jgi:hypothetical protein
LIDDARFFAGYAQNDSFPVPTRHLRRLRAERIGPSTDCKCRFGHQQISHRRRRQSSAKIACNRIEIERVHESIAVEIASQPVHPRAVEIAGQAR